MLEEFLNYLKEQIDNHSIYVYGGQGQKSPLISESFIKSMETSSENAERAIKYWKKQVALGYKDVLRAFDCSGLGSFFLLNKKLIPKDMTAHGFMGQCSTISFKDLRPGDFVFKLDSSRRAHHMGYVFDKNLNVVEAKGRDHGVMKSPYKDWDVCGRPPYFRDAEGAGKSRILKLKSPYMKGEDVRALQNALKAKGFSPGTADGVFGPRTNKALRAFQAAAKLQVDGLAGPKTFAALGLKYVQ